MSPSEQAALRGRAINGDKAALKQWLALPKDATKKPEPAKEPEAPAEPALAAPEPEDEKPKYGKDKKKKD